MLLTYFTYLLTYLLQKEGSWKKGGLSLKGGHFALMPHYALGISNWMGVGGSINMVGVVAKGLCLSLVTWASLPLNWRCKSPGILCLGRSCSRWSYIAGRLLYETKSVVIYPKTDRGSKTRGAWREGPGHILTRLSSITNSGLATNTDTAVTACRPVPSTAQHVHLATHPTTTRT